MDYVLLSTLVGVTVTMLVISYDIVCQWCINFADRLSQFPTALQSHVPNMSITTVIPKFHIYAHGKKCQSKWSLNFCQWMGRTDGKGVKQE